MAFNDIRLADENGGDVPTRVWQAEAAATAILAGEPVKAKIAGSRYAIPLADAEPVIGATTAVMGIAKSASTQTATADGIVEVFEPKEGVLYSARAKTAALADTQAEIDALVGKRVVLDFTAGSYTVDTAAADAATNGILIVGGDFTHSTIFFFIRTSATILN